MHCYFWRPTYQAPTDAPFNAVPTDDLCVLHLRAG